MTGLVRQWIVAGLVAAAVAAAAPAAGAQQPGPRAGERRAQLEARVREQFARVVKERLDLTDEQLRKLAQTTQRFEQRRRLLLEQERDARMGLRQELMAADDKANQDRVARLLEELVSVQRQRLQIFEEEQRELATFLTPVQRAKFAALQEGLRKRVEQARQNRTDRRGGRPRPD
jgi:Spy/CpxP family protein refolding chaperone